MKPLVPRVVCVIAALLLLAAPVPSTAATLIVELRDASSRLADVLHDHGWKAESRSIQGAWHRLSLPGESLDGPAGRRVIDMLRSDPRVRHAMPEPREQRTAMQPNDGRFGDQWWLQAVSAGNTGAAGFVTAWSRSTGSPVSGPVPIVAVLDSGITSHPELNPRLVPGHDFVSDPAYSNDGNGRDNDPADPGDAVTDADRASNPAAFGGCPQAPLSSWHGTVIAGQVAAVTNNTEGVAAGNWVGRVMPVRVAGKCGAALGDIVDGLRWAAGLAVAGVPANPTPARLIVLSYGGIDSCDIGSATPEIASAARLYRDAIAEARAAGALVIVAAGNGRQAAGRPASCPGAFGVVSLNREGYKSTYSNFGPGLALATPGGDAASGGTCDAQLADSGLVSTSNLGDTSPGAAGYAAASGTSFAAPVVAAVATLMLAVEPRLTVAQLEDGLKRSARPHVKVPLLGACAVGTATAGRCECSTETCGAGILDADEALRFAAAPASYAAPSRAASALDDDRLRACAVLLGRAAPEEPPPAASAPQASEGGGGGVAPAWLVLLAAAAVALRARVLRRPARGGWPAGHRPGA